jgi:murein DD-endopeptidase MepM/ murein hydrolase activator NlpD
MKTQLTILAFAVSALMSACNGDSGPTGPDDMSETSVTPTGPAGDPVMVTPYDRAGNIRNISGVYSSDSNNPWGGGPHSGIDFHTTENLRPFQAVFAGTIGTVELWQNDINGLWQVDVTIVYNSNYSAYYAFEPMTGARADGQTQLDNILVSVGQAVSRGEVIGSLFNSGEGAHVHWGLFDDANRTDICPEPFFNDAASNSIMTIVHRDNPDWEMCY